MVGIMEKEPDSKYDFNACFESCKVCRIRWFASHIVSLTVVSVMACKDSMCLTKKPRIGLVWIEISVTMPVVVLDAPYSATGQ